MLIDQIIRELEVALELGFGSLNESTRSEDVPEWDSLGHITILAKLDSLFDNVSERVPELVEASSVSEILAALKRDGRLE
jgi:hypothetical protein